MARDADPCAAHTGLLSLEEALSRLLMRARPIETSETVAVSVAAGRVLKEPVLAPMPFPRFDQAAMDGYAVRFPEIAPAEGYRLEGESAAGHPYEGALLPGGCIRIFTGAKLPEGADAVIMQEAVERVGGRIKVPAGTPIHPGDHIRRQGEELQAGDLLVPAGRRLRPADLGLLAAAGFGMIPVLKPLRVGVIATGDELKREGSSLAPGEIFESNRPVLRALLEAEGFAPVDGGILPDQPSRIVEALEHLAPEVDVMLTLGGASVGDHDHLAGIVGARGQLGFWKVAIKPGKPFLYGEIGGVPILGLPGNPVSMMVTFLALARPFLQKSAGRTPQRPLRVQALTETRIRKAPGRLEFRRGLLFGTAEGLKVHCLPGQGSHQLTSMSQANCFVLLAPSITDIPAGEAVWVTPFPEALETPLNPGVMGE